MPVLVTGATGFTGGHLARRLRALGHPVRALVRPGADVAALQAAGVRLVEGDIRKAADVRRAVAGVRKIYHIAAVFRTAGHPDSFYRDVNRHGTEHVLEAAAAACVERTVHCSTIGVHGDVREIACTEDSPFNPGDIYQKTKLAGELAARAAFDAGLPGVIFRPAGIYGPGDLRFLKLFKAIQQRRFVMFGTGTVDYHLTYIDDLIDGIMLCGEHPNALGQTYIFAGGRYHTLNEVITAIATAVDVPPPKGRLPYWPLAAGAALCEMLCRPFGIEPPLHRRRAAFFIKRRAFSIEKAQRELGYAPAVPLEEGLRRTAAWYFAQGMEEQAVFSLFVRRLPERRNFLLACGLDTVLEYLEALRFTSDDTGYLRSLGQFSDGFLDSLQGFRFSGDVHAVLEGMPVFANEPILEVVAPIAEAQLVETFVMNQVHLQTVLASKAARVVAAAKGRAVVDFGPRRMHGVDAALKAARAFHIAGVSATSNVLAGKICGVPVAGTMAHSLIQSFDDELEALRAFARLYPETVLLVDTYDTLEGVAKVIRLARELGPDFKVRAIRLDSGDLADLAFKARQVLDDAGLHQVEIFASGSLDEDAIAGLLAKCAPITGFGVGTKMGVSSDAPDLDIAYKLCDYAGRGRLKLSTGKPVLPGRKQVFRVEQEGRAIRDVIARAGEKLEGRALLQPVMQNGRRTTSGQIDLGEARDYAAAELGRLPAYVRAIEHADPPYPVEVSAALRSYQDEIAQAVAS